jgi:hypothetical protein
MISTADLRIFADCTTVIEYGDRMNLRIGDIVQLKTGGLSRISFVGALDSV